jgi:hypothetical protein
LIRPLITHSETYTAVSGSSVIVCRVVLVNLHLHGLRYYCVNFDLNKTQSTQGGGHYLFEDRGSGIYGEYVCITEKGTTQLKNKKKLLFQICQM